MSAPFLASITVVGPKGANTHLALITPLGGAHAGHDLPEGPWGPVDPGWGVDPGFGGGTPVPPSVWPPMPPPPLPPELENMVIVAVHRPGVAEWSVKAHPVPQPKG